MSSPESFEERRELQQQRLLELGSRSTKRFINLDGAVYRSGALPARTKELLGLVASMVLRCEDCIKYHLTRCHREGVETAELIEALDVALIVGGSIVVPHYRHALEHWESLTDEEPTARRDR